MQVKIFTENGYDGIGKLEKQINAWLTTGAGKTIKHTETAMCQVAESPNGERYQCLVISVWYE